MSALRIRIDKHIMGGTSGPPHVYAKIYPLSEEGAQRASGRSVLEELIPVSSQPNDAKVINLEPGRYYVETVLPYGEVLADDVLVLKGKTQDLVLRGEHSPHEWLSWQHLVGNVQSSPPVKQPEIIQPTVYRSKSHMKKAKSRRSAKSSSKGNAERARRSGSATTDRQFRKVAASAPKSSAAIRRLPEVNLGNPIQCLSHPYPPLVKQKYSHHMWAWLADISSTDPVELVSILNEGHKPFEIQSYTHDSAHAVFHVSSLMGYDNAAPSRYFAVVQRRRSVELISLPIPWRVVTTTRDADIEIVTQQPIEDGGFCTAATALDEQLGMLLGYLTSGSLPTARQMAETARVMLYNKFENPFAAAAGAYALVGTALKATDQEWHGWVRNLMNNFEHIPDGAIQWGQLKLRIRHKSDDIEEARKAFKVAYERGLPFYSMGMRWLLDGLEWAAQDDLEAEEMLRNVRRIAWRTHFQQPFTIIRLGGDRSV